MEKQYVITLMLLLGSVFSVKPQDSLLIFKTQGNVMFSSIQGSIIRAEKGKFIRKMDALVLEKGAELTAIDKKGAAYKVDNPGRFNLQKILDLPLQKPKSGLTTKYFRYLWQEFIRNGENAAIIGGVFRGDIPMLFPPDSASIASAKINFRWKIQVVETSFFFLWDSSDNLILKAEVSGTQINLFRQSTLLKEGEQYKWAITQEAYPNFKNINHWNFNLIDRNIYHEYKEDMKPLETDLKSLGLNESEIEKILCETYGLCL
ncbi:hypothetical protein ACT6NV_10215 [Robiginitalea sp. IMCC44478]|uniref:hypothetical protein n=1 Tax=Robiginitalea sp. IMCC44478 TaxID=3459122 RepID=UPI0040424515